MLAWVLHEGMLNVVSEWIGCYWCWLYICYYLILCYFVLCYLYMIWYGEGIVDDNNNIKDINNNIDIQIDR